MNDLLLRALACQNTERPPVWLMRQAGRYMASYRSLRSKYSFLEMCHQPDLIRKVTLLPIEAYGLDAAILFSDILVVPEAMGLGLHFKEDHGPVIERPIREAQDIDRIGSPRMESLDYVRQGILQLREDLSVPLLGFCGAPFTIASYMIEGQTSRDLKKTKQWMYRHPQEFHRLLHVIADWSVEYLRLQIDAGVQAVQIFDSWANVLALPQFLEFSLAYLRLIMQRLNRSVPIILFCRGSSVFASELANIQPAAISLDWNCDITQMRASIPSSIAIQGNLDPYVLYGSSTVIEKETCRILEGMAGDPGFIFNLGHGILPDIPEESVRILVETVQQWVPCPTV